MDNPSAELPLDQAEEIDRLADEFERRFRAGNQPRIEDFLERLPNLRTELLRQLLALEIELRQATSDPGLAEEYRRRFPQDGDIISAVVSPDPPRTGDHGSRPADDEDDPQPKQIGRYEIRRKLGRGGFGVVYLAHDPQLDRPVALKVPRRERFETAEQVARFVEEARTAARLKHSLLVAVHDVQEHAGLPYIVQEFIDGQNLGDWSATEQPSFEQIARVFVDVSEALGYAHQQGLTHCDLKLANVLMDSAGQPHVADFGLTVHEDAQALRKGEVFGTPATMAPEQVRGESHRLDGRTDMWAIGVMLYELLVGRRPFSGDSRQELFCEIQGHDPKPPRQIDHSIPRELERICLKCLSKRRSHRYNTTDDLREDMLTWLGKEVSTERPQSTQAPQPSAVSRAPDSSSGSKPPVKIIPKGLRAFDEDDADFFLELMPGPRDRDGLPESIRFWKKRIELTDPDHTFSVGLIYGPSGCGKSSLVKAGLLPKLGDKVLTVYVEATADDTEFRLLKQLRKHIPRLPADCSLPEACAELRLTGAGRDRKILLVMDQFEQWLHSHAELRNCQLVDALRQCEGGRLQAVLLVRDDFFAGVHGLFQELDIPLVDGRNYALVDRFDKDHAYKVLAAFGRAFGKLTDDLSPEQEEFLTQAVNELAQDGKIVCVRLALFAEMLKAHSWVPASLQEVGGVGGVGVAFLEETFDAKTAPPSHRVHQQAIRSLLGTLLPDVGSDIKGSMQSTKELRERSGYQDSGRQFEALIHILDSELRLITPTDPEGSHADPSSEPESRYYQLTHDYLVPCVRDWLTRKQRETRRGRAELRLGELSAAWHAKPENRHLPNVFEWLRMRLLTDLRAWTVPQRRMMDKAARRHATYWGSILAGLLVVGLGIQQYAASLRGQTNARDTSALVDTFRSAHGPAIPLLLDRLAKLPRPLVQKELRSRFSNAEGQHNLSLAYGLAQFDQVDVDAIIAGIIDVDTSGSEVANIVTALTGAKDEAIAELRAAATTASTERNWKIKARLAVIAMYLGDTSLAADMLRGTSILLTSPWNPVQRTIFIAEFPGWCGETEKLAEILRDTRNSDVRSGISLALGSIKRPDRQAKEEWQKVFAQWNTDAVDSGTHSAASWAMRKWGVELPPLEPTEEPMDGHDWWRTPLNLTMLRIASGRVASESRPIVIQEPFWLSDREISIALFKQFVTDAAADQPDDWEGAHTFRDQVDDSHPVQQVSWEDAVMFCNWLSDRHGFERCYKVEPIEDRRQKYSVTWKEDADGFRLPSEDEWEYACRAGTTTDYACGNDEDQLIAYAVFRASSTRCCGSLLCNAWGLFDMHGNVWEWCWDERAYGRVYRGGSWFVYARDCRSSFRSWFVPSDRSYILGFRVARGPLSSTPVGEAESGSR